MVATARSRGPGQEEEEEEDDHDGTGEIVAPVSDVLSTNKYNDDDSLDFLEGVGLVDQWDLVNELKGKPVEEIEKDIKVVESLKGKVEVWKKFGAGKMVLQVLGKGLRLNFVGKGPVAYEEKEQQVV